MSIAQTNPPPPDKAHVDAPGAARPRPGAVVRWLRAHLRRESIVGSLKTLAWVAPLTLLVWIWAERVQEVRQTLTLQVELKTNAPDRVLKISGGDKTIVCEISGPRRGIDQVQEALAGRRDRIEVFIPKEDLPSEDRILFDVPIQTLLARQPFFRERAVAVDRSRPNYLVAEVDPLETRRLPVVPSPRDEEALGKVTLSADASGRPLEVEVTAPRSVFLAREDTAPKAAQLRVLADLSAYHDRVGEAFSAEVPVRFEKATPNVRLPERVRVEVRPPASMPSKELRPVWIVVEISKRMLDQYQLECPDKLLRDNSAQAVTVYGPQAQLDRMGAENSEYSGNIKLRITSDDEKTPGEQVRTLTQEDFDLPPGVRLGEGEYQVKFRLVPR